MTTPLLTTKLYIPPTRPELVSRPRLVERLNAGLLGQSGRFARKLTVISAPAGFGKTTLLSEWIADCGHLEPKVHFGWVSLDESDNDPIRFLSYFIVALQTIEPGTGGNALSALQSPKPPPTDSLLTSLINEIAERLPASILVLDDYHLITAQPIHDALSFLLDHLPDSLHLAVATRADPPLPVARLRARGELTELRLADLRFTLEEATAFLERVTRLEFTPDDIAALASRTEGWIAGLQMAAVSMQERDDVDSFIQAFTGSHRYILDYLVEEVLQRQPESVQTFLLQTSILDRLSGPLCDAVCLGQATDQQTADSQATLEYLERTNLFTIPLDDERRWFRYHRLFTDLLRSRLHQSPPSVPPAGGGDARRGVAELHLRASRWYEQNGLTAEAIRHAVLAKEPERAADLIEQAAEETLMRSEVVTFLTWVEMLPDELVRARPTLCLYYAWALVLGGSPLKVVESHLQDVTRSLGADEHADVALSRVAIMRAFIMAFQDELSKAAELSRQALEQLPEDDSYLRNIAGWILGMTHLMSGDVASGARTMDEVIRASQEIGNVLVTVAALTQLAEIQRRQGKLHEAKATHERALELATDSQGRILPVAGKTLIGLGKLWREWNDLETATRYLLEGIELTKQWREVAALEGHIYLARVRQAQGDWDGACEAIQRALQLAVEFDSTEIDDHLVALHQTRLWIRQGDIGAASAWLREQGLDTKAGPAELMALWKKGSDSFADQFRQYGYVVLAEVLIKQSRFDQALALVEPLMETTEQQGLISGALVLHILRALALQGKGDIEQAMVALERALTLAEPGGYVRTFVDEGEPMAKLLREAAGRGIAADYVNKLLAVFGTAEERPPKPPASGAPALVDPLSERELEVLRLLRTTLSTPEIAEQLVVSANTVRSHIKNIYSKLDVHKRAEAVQRAGELGLI